MGGGDLTTRPHHPLSSASSRQGDVGHHSLPGPHCSSRYIFLAGRTHSLNYLIIFLFPEFCLSRPVGSARCVSRPQKPVDKLIFAASAAELSFVCPGSGGAASLLRVPGVNIVLHRRMLCNIERIVWLTVFTLFNSCSQVKS